MSTEMAWIILGLIYALAIMGFAIWIIIKLLSFWGVI